jgi:uncharacterized SAM-binding protein YcdF (DUF218 family)
MISDNHFSSAVIVLANLMDQAGVLNDESAARAAKAVELFDAHDASILVTCGWPYRKDCSLPIAQAFRDHILARYAVPTEAIVLETQSRDTVGDAWFTKTNVIVPKGVRKLHVVTSAYHVPRTMEIFKLIYGPSYEIDVAGAVVPEDRLIIENEARSIYAFRRTFEGVTPGDDSEILLRLRERHPFYNGAVYPRI